MLKFYLRITKWKPGTYGNKIGPHLDLDNKQIHTNKPFIPKYRTKLSTTFDSTTYYQVKKHHRMSNSSKMNIEPNVTNIIPMADCRMFHDVEMAHIICLDLLILCKCKFVQLCLLRALVC